MLCGRERARVRFDDSAAPSSVYILCMRVLLRIRDIYTGYFIIATAKIRIPAGRNGRPRDIMQFQKASGRSDDPRARYTRSIF